MLRHMASAAIWVVVNHHIAWLEAIVSDFVEEALNRVHDGAQLGRAVLSLRQHLPVSIEDGAREVPRFVEYGRISGPHHRRTHLATDVYQRIVNDAKRYRFRGAAS